MAQQQQLDLLGVDLLAAAVDQVLDAALDGDVALAVDHRDRGEVAGAVEAVGGEGARVVLGARRSSRAACTARGSTARRPAPSGSSASVPGLEHADLVERARAGCRPWSARAAAGRAGPGGEEQALAHAEQLPGPQAAALERRRTARAAPSPRTAPPASATPASGREARRGRPRRKWPCPSSTWVTCSPGHQRQRARRGPAVPSTRQAPTLCGACTAHTMPGVVDDRDQVRDAAVRRPSPSERA